MKQTVLAAMVMMTMAGSVSAEVTAWDYFWGTTISQGLDPKINGWDDFWGRCTYGNYNSEKCKQAIAAGTLLVISAPVIFISGVAIASIFVAPVATTVILPAIIAGPSLIPAAIGG